MKMNIYRDSLIQQTSANEREGNAYGLVVCPDGTPIICGHGGSMWFCISCAEKYQEGLKNKDKS